MDTRLDECASVLDTLQGFVPPESTLIALVGYAQRFAQERTF
jgi:hypothetical protein